MLNQQKKKAGAGVFGAALLALGVTLGAIGSKAAGPEGSAAGESSVGGWVADDSGRPAPCGGSGDVPTPFLNTNQRVELSDGELYTLVGRIHALRDSALFEVDLAEHPWLASARRKASPLYGLEGSPSFWRRFDGKKVRVLVEAKGIARLSPATGEPEYWLSLQPVADPIVISSRPPVRGGDPR